MSEASESPLPPDPLKESVGTVKHAFEEASRYFESRGHAGDERYSHLNSVVDYNRVLPMESAEFTAALEKQGKSPEEASATPAQYMGERGGILVDSVIVRKGVKVDSQMMTHEFIHRATDMRGLQGKDKPHLDQMYEALGYPRSELNAMKQSKPEEYQRVLRYARETLRIFNEGLTQWVTVFLAERTAQFPHPVESKAYPDEVAAVRETFESSLNVRGLSHSPDQIDELMLDLALTGDFSKLRAAIPIGEDLRAVGIGDSYYVGILMQLTDGAFQSKRLARMEVALKASSLVQSSEDILSPKDG